MIEKLPTDTKLPKVAPSPLDLAKVVMRRRGAGVDVATDSFRMEESLATTEHSAGDIIERDGRKYMLVPQLRTAERWEDGRRVYYKVPYTFREYYSHTFPEPSTGRVVPGPGWDSKFHLTDQKFAETVHGRTFSDQELSDLPTSLPNTDCLVVKDLEDDYAIEEYLEYRKSIEQ